MFFCTFIAFHQHLNEERDSKKKPFQFKQEASLLHIPIQDSFLNRAVEEIHQGNWPQIGLFVSQFC